MIFMKSPRASNILCAQALSIARRLLAGALFVALALSDAGSPMAAGAEPAASMAESPASPTPPPEVKKIVDRRCVVCHGCYDSPCQLNMTSGAGMLRGANKTPVYEPERLNAAPLTRLGVDGHSTEDWRRLGFYSVGPDEGRETIEASQIWNMLKLKRERPLDANAPLPDSLSLKLNRPLSCPKREEFANYARERPLAGMPYAMAPLGDSESRTLVDWLKSGSPMAGESIRLPQDLRDQINEWEAFLNESDPKHKLVARYLYEHLFLAHVSFDGGDSRHFFRLVRSATPPGAPATEIPTRRPYDDPGVKEIYYRFIPITDTLLRKTHIVYGLGRDRLARIKDLFIRPEWAAGEPPSYEPAIASNPFKAFSAIPAASRYQFLLDDALFFIRTFIHGPACRGQVAVDVIDDRFWVMFLAPAADLSVTDPSYLRNAAEYLGLPAELANANLVHGASPAHLAYHRRYVNYRKQRYHDQDPEGRGFELSDIWDGGQGKGGEANASALLTVFRHFDSASVVTGFVGSAPKTAWVIDYATLERIYYNLVAGFDVYGNFEHQLGTRLYMDLLRMESEALFLEFLPAKDRRHLQETWYGGALAQTVAFLENGRVDVSRDTRIAYKTTDTKTELLFTVLKRGAGRWPVADPINRCGTPPCSLPGVSPAEQRVQESLHEIAAATGPWVRETPELSLLRIRNPEGADAFYSLIHDRAHTNVAFMFFEDHRLRPEKDEMTVYPGFAGSYPNFFFDVTAEQLATFVKELKGVSSSKDFFEFVAKYGVRRSSPKFWEVSDAFQDALKRLDPVEAGLLDLNRYIDPKSNGAAPDAAPPSHFFTSALARVMKRAKGEGKE